MPEGYLESMRIGRALAAQSHELKNVLAIVGESAGLLEDLFEMAAAEGLTLPENLAAATDKSLRSISTQVARGHRLCTDLNTMAHMPDNRQDAQLPSIDLGHVAALAVRFMERPARQSEITLLAPEPAGYTSPGDPLVCLTALMALLESVWQGLSPDTELAVQSVPGTASVEFIPAAAADSLSDEARQLCEQAGLEVSPSDGGLRVTLKEGAS